VKFSSRPDDQFVVVGTVRDLILNPRSLTGGSIHVYLLVNGERLELLHKTPVDDLPGAIAAFKGKLLAGIGRYLRVYDLGKKKLLRKCENKVGLYAN